MAEGKVLKKNYFDNYENWYIITSKPISKQN
jgi:hypothetical protein